jgi:hypothetical protein
MAQKVQIILVDDIDGGPAEKTLSFSYEGASYEIDLSAANAAKLKEALDRYIDGGRRVGGRSSAGRGRARRGSGDNRTAQIREWARANGHQVNERGRVAAGIVAAYNAAHA